MTLRRTLFPATSRCFTGQRGVNVALRTLHLIGIAGIGAAYLYTTVSSAWWLYFYLALASGAGLAALYLWSNGIWLIQLRGQVILLKLLLLALIPLFPNLRAGLFLAVIILSGWIAHAPGNVRYYSLWHRRRLERF
jgi:hypothetical protein